MNNIHVPVKRYVLKAAIELEEEYGDEALAAAYTRIDYAVDDEDRRLWSAVWAFLMHQVCAEPGERIVYYINETEKLEPAP